jgi:hypothetical protein
MSVAPAASSPPQPDSRPPITDSKLGAINAYPMLFLGMVLLVYFVWFGVTELSQIGPNHSLLNLGFALLGVIGSFIFLNGLVILKPNESLFGSYVGTEQRSGFCWVNPFNSKKKVSRRLETLECGPLKVNDAVGNPVDIGRSWSGASRMPPRHSWRSNPTRIM